MSQQVAHYHRMFTFFISHHCGVCTGRAAALTEERVDQERKIVKEIIVTKDYLADGQSASEAEHAVGMAVRDAINDYWLKATL